MKGDRPLTPKEIRQIQELFLGKDQKRNYALFTLAYHSGLRISELLSLTVGDVIQNGKAPQRIYVKRTHMKGKKSGRSVLFTPAAQEAVALWLAEHPNLQPSAPLFISQKRSKQGKERAISYQMAWIIYHRAAEALGLDGKVACHSSRKSHAQQVYKLTGHDLIKTQKSLGHSSITTTIQYLSFDEDELDEVLLKL